MKFKVIIVYDIVHNYKQQYYICSKIKLTIFIGSYITNKTIVNLFLELIFLSLFSFNNAVYELGGQQRLNMITPLYYILYLPQYGRNTLI